MNLVYNHCYKQLVWVVVLIEQALYVIIYENILLMLSTNVYVSNWVICGFYGNEYGH